MQDELLDDLEQELSSGFDDERGDDDAPPEPKAKPAVDPEEFKRSQRAAEERIARLERELSETRQAQQFWAQQQQEPAKPAAPVDPDNWLEEIESKGAAAFEGRFATPEQVAESVNRAVQQIQSKSVQDQFASEYPELTDPTSDLYQKVDELLTGKYAAIARVPQTKFEALKLAAAEAKSQLERGDRLRGQRAGAAGAYRPINGGNGGGSGSRSTALTPAQRLFASKLEVPQKAVLSSLNELEGGRR
jgi:hypothetical protein